ncbi:MAG: S8 family serine peptidase, partial [Thermoplasmata archaeon]|nr:S8 family serine peptidase [Thermoplasmata archaeon]
MNITIIERKNGIIIVSLILAFALIVPSSFLVAGIAPGTTEELESAPVQQENAAPAQNQIQLKYAQFDPLVSLPNVPAQLMSRPSNIPNTKMPYILQHEGPITEEWVNELAQDGVEIVSYIPDNAYLVRLSDDQVDTMKGHNGVRWMGEYQPAYKLDPQVDGANGMVDISVMLFPDATNSYVVKLLKVVGGQVLGIAHNDKVNTLKIRVDASYLPTIAAMPEVRYISMVEMNTILNDSTTQYVQSGSTTGTWPIHAKGITGKGQIAAIGDSGVRVDHQNFLGNVYGASGTEAKILDYFISADTNAEMGDEAAASYHGSHCAGTVLGDGPTYGTYQTATYDGHAYMAQLVFLDCGRTDDPSTPATDEGEYIYTPTDMYNDYFGVCEWNYGAKVHSNSWGGGFGYDDGSAEIDRYMWDSQDYTICFAAGNDGSAASTIGSQAEAKNLICVGSITNTGTGVSTFSSRGPCVDGRIKPDLMAPGESIQSVNGGGTTTYQLMDGTSMATPATTGASALVRAYYSEGWYPTGAKIAANGFSPSAALVKATMISGAVPIAAIPNMNEGWGRIHLENSLYFVGDTIKT